MADLDGVWKVERTGGLLPALIGVRKHIEGDHGETRIAGLVGVPFRVEDRSLRYEPPFGGFVDVLEGTGGRISGRATFRGREFGRFRMIRMGGGRP